MQRSARKDKGSDAEAEGEAVTSYLIDRFSTNGQCVYAAFVPSGYMKIGIATDPKGRVRALQIGNPEPISLVACTKISKGSPVSGLKMEQMLHYKLKPKSKRGEWFEVDIIDLDAIWVATHRFLAMPFDHPALYVFGGGRKHHTDKAIHGMEHLWGDVLKERIAIVREDSRAETKAAKEGK